VISSPPQAGALVTPRPFLPPSLLGSVLAAAVLVASFLGGSGHAFADASVAQSVTYAVQPGDSVETIATQYGISVADLVTGNPTANPGELTIGQTLTVAPSPGQSSSVPASATGWVSVSWQTSHFAAFAIAPDGVVRRSLSPLPRDFPTTAIIAAPFYSQFDGSDFADADCGPTALSMALGALGVDAGQLNLRALADVQMRDDDPDNGTTWASLAYAAAQFGATARGWARGKTYRHWSLDDARTEIAAGHPVLLLVRYWDLPDHRQSDYGGDHYVVALGMDRRGDVVYHDPAFRGDGAYRFMTAAQLRRAWGDVAEGPDFAWTAMALAR
jgi:hypothetical protein